MSRDFPVILSIAGSDSSGGAGIQADVKTACALGVHAMTVITAITAQNTCGVKAVEAVPPSFLRKQLDTVTEDILPDVIKIGMIPDPEAASVIADFLEKVNLPVVADPVIASTSGHLFSSPETLDLMRRRIIPFVTLLTPNIPEAAAIIGRVKSTEGSFVEVAEEIIEKFGCGGVLIKGGHTAAEILTDTLVVGEDDACKKYVREFIHPKIMTNNTHGTGCTLSSAIASFMARGFSVSAAVEAGIEYLTKVLTLNAGKRIGQGYGPVGCLYS